MSRLSYLLQWEKDEIVDEKIKHGGRPTAEEEERNEIRQIEFNDAHPGWESMEMEELMSLLQAESEQNRAELAALRSYEGASTRRGRLGRSCRRNGAPSPKEVKCMATLRREAHACFYGRRNPRERASGFWDVVKNVGEVAGPLMQIAGSFAHR